MIRVYNTLTKSKEAFETVQSGKVGIYLCGPTVYKPSHIGHMVGPVIFDTIKRFLVHNGYDVKFVVNITDVDDKLIAESNARKTTMKAVADEMTADYMQNLSAMGIDSIDCFPKATEYMAEIIKFVEDLIDKGFAYASDGDVYFNVQKFPEYGKLSHRSLEQMLGEGGSTVDRKQSSCDFALWKSAKANEPAWDSPWGKGRPGWHIECSVMSGAILGETFDIHGGGLDLVFPHHENEIAQSEARHGKQMAKYWLHNGLMQASSETSKLGGRPRGETQSADAAEQEAGKISKSKGASAFRDMLKQFDPEAIRFFILSSHYRRPIDFSFERIEQVGTGMETFYRFFKRYNRVTGDNFFTTSAPRTRAEGEFEPGDDPLLKQVHEYRTKFFDAMDDDFNTGGAIGILFDLLRVLNKYVDDNKIEGAKNLPENVTWPLVHGTTVLRELCNVLGLFRREPAEKASDTNDEVVGKLMNLIIELRAAARANKDFATADKIRNSLAEVGIVIEDRPGGTEWSKK
ncbi:MAG: cysteine--tRNA ligase [Thermoguttaceae bacterium]